MFRLLFADERGVVYDHPELLATARSGGDVIRPPGRPRLLPPGGTLGVLPGRRPVGIDPATGAPVELGEAKVGRRKFRPVAVGATLPPGWTRTLLPAAARPPLGALACGCVLFSSFNHALADTLDPGQLGHQIGCGSLAADLERISAAVADPVRWRPAPERLQQQLEVCSEAALLQRWRLALELVETHWQRLLTAEATPLRSPSMLRLHVERLRQCLAKLPLGRLPRWPARP